MIMKTIDKLKSPFKNRGKQPPTAIDPGYFLKSEIAAFKVGAYYHLYDKLGAHLTGLENIDGAYFAVWAPAAKRVSVVGDFNGWDKRKHVLNMRSDRSGIWEGFVPGASEGQYYKYHITSKAGRHESEKADPLAFYSESAPKTASILTRARYQWNDGAWMDQRETNDPGRRPMSVYEVHLGSWRRREDGSFLTYRDLADSLVDYVRDMGFTHVEFMPLMEHPFYGSWGYQALSYFAPTGRYGKPEDLMYLIDRLHQNGIGIIFDWVVSHFPYDNYGLANFDGTRLYEDGDLHPDWNSCTFNLGRHETLEFLISSALYWIEQYHVDGLRVDAVASMLYLDYSRKDGQWKPNFFGGRENLEAISFIRRLNETVKERHPGVQMIAEDSTAWPKVTKPSSVGGLNFDMKWNMGWMHDTLKYFSRDCKLRGRFHEEIAFCLYYAFSENFVLSLSHDEVVYEKRSLIGKMPGEGLEPFSNLRALLGFMYAHPGKKLLFMGDEIAQWNEWNHDGQLDWHLLEQAAHRQFQQYVKDLNLLHKNEIALHEQDFSSEGFEWLDMGQNRQAVFSFLRKGTDPKNDILVVCNFRNKARRNYTVGISSKGAWNEILNSDDQKYGGKGMANKNTIQTEHKPWVFTGISYSDTSSHYTKEFSISLDLPPLSVTFFGKE